MQFTFEILQKAQAAKSAAELLTIAGENGIPMTAEEAENYFTRLHRKGALADEELDNVSGGCGGDDDGAITMMKCANCGDWGRWKGNFMTGSTYECPVCHHNTYVGLYLEG